MNAAAPSLTLRARALAFAERRLPSLTRLRQAEPLPIALTRRRIYVLPTRFGIGFALLLFIMLIGALNYGNNPALLLTCLLGAAAWASLFAGFRAMSGLTLLRVHADECHAGDAIHLRLGFAASASARPGLHLRCGDRHQVFALRPAGDPVATIDLPTTRRGWFSPGRMKIWSEYPLGFFHVWSWINPQVAFLVFPAAEMPRPPLPLGRGRDGDQTARRGSEDLAGLRDYRSSDATRLIAWKASARHDTLLVRETERQSGAALVFDYETLHGLDHEARIARLTAWVLAAEAETTSYALVLPRERFEPGVGLQQRQACLRALALLPDAP